jgi:alkylated DNA repair dioxygenase AlkB
MTRTNVSDGGWYAYDPCFLSREEGERYLAILRSGLSWQVYPTRWGGKLRRPVAFCGDRGVNYQYTGVSHIAEGWPPFLDELKRRVESATGLVFNGALVNLYRNGLDTVGYHRDNESMLIPGAPIGSLSLGAARRFLLKHDHTKYIIELELEHGSLLILGGTIQDFWTHTIPPQRHVRGERINVNFRRFFPPTPTGSDSEAVR